MSDRKARGGVAPALIGIVLLAATATRTGAQTPPPVRASAVDAATLRGLQRTEPVRARLWLADRRDTDAALVGMGGQHVAYASYETPTLIQGVIERDVIQRAEFELTLDQGELADARRRRDWPKVYRLLHAALSPAMPYLALPDNNAAESVLQLGTVMMRIAARTEREAATDEARERVRRQYEAAAAVWEQLAGAEWSPLSLHAVVRGAQCLLKTGRPDAAEERLAELLEPAPGDAVYGLFWLTRAQIAAHRGDIRSAMDDAVRSLAFESKDIESFPDALMLSAACYEALLEWHRARDVYFEVASLFPATDWADDAAARLRHILDAGHVDADEEGRVEAVFFGTREDITALARGLLQERAGASPAD